ncbi:hypothetical protein BDV26DRAFT_299267 [Aspergillus bertholletiae]|uniref:Uncharacterized protein n=1 Tax=Aspergillus bertholletiae TaxID=1226010 RepID=A0A5N7APQ6_9EURO|nr:hypothetical protein BDV26DRAFT_299267 [Aspergillus bertholletiae]
MEHPIFQKLDGLPVIICKACQHGVWPNEIVHHLKGSAHAKPHEEAVQIQETIQHWENIAMGPEGIIIPHQINQAWPELPIYPDGLMYRRDSPRCRYIGRSMNSIRSHWRTVYGWTRQGSRGRVTPAERIRSHYIHIRGGETKPYIPVQMEQIDQAIKDIKKTVQEAQTHALSSHREDIHDANS